MEPLRNAPQVVGRYVLFGELASGGMATVHLARILGESGFSKTVAIKRLHPQFAKGPRILRPCFSTRPGSPLVSSTATW